MNHHPRSTPSGVRGPSKAPSSRLEVAAAALRRKDASTAERALIAHLAVAPRDVDALRLLGIVQHMQRNFAGAAAILREALSLKPDDALIHNNLGSALRGAGDLEGAVIAFRRSAELAPGLPAPWYNLGKALKNETYPEEAREAFAQALRCDPGYVRAWMPMGDVCKAIGDIDAAVDCYRKAVRHIEHAPHAWFHLANLKTVRFDDDDVAQLSRLFNLPGLSDDSRVHVGYALCKALEDQDQDVAAFDVLNRTNRLKRRSVSWSTTHFSAQITAIDAAFARPATVAKESTLGRQVIFIVSLPRSGSTLTEQILASHAQVEGANELKDLPEVLVEESKRRGRGFPDWAADASTQDWERLGRDYLARTQRWQRNAPYFVDKGLSNWQFVGAAAAMLPGARFVNCRRDPVETCVSCFRQLFANGNFFSYDLIELAAYWRDYDRLCRSWKQRYPERWFDEIYEELLADPDAQIRRLLDFLGLPFDPACLEFHRAKRVVRTASAAQVRQPLRRDTARAHRYGNALDALREALSGA